MALKTRAIYTPAGLMRLNSIEIAMGFVQTAIQATVQ